MSEGKLLAALDLCFVVMMQPDYDDGKIKSCTLKEWNEARVRAEKLYYEAKKEIPIPTDLQKFIEDGYSRYFDLHYREELVIREIFNEGANLLVPLLEQQKERTKELENYIYEIRPKHDAYNSVCSVLGIESDILGHVQKLEKQLKQQRKENEEKDKRLEITQKWLDEFQSAAGQANINLLLVKQENEKLKEENEELKRINDIGHKNYLEQLEHIGTLQQENQSLKQRLEAAEKEKIELEEKIVSIEEFFTKRLIN